MNVPRRGSLYNGEWVGHTPGQPSTVAVIVLMILHLNISSGEKTSKYFMTNLDNKMGSYLNNLETSEHFWSHFPKRLFSGTPLLVIILQLVYPFRGLAQNFTNIMAYKCRALGFCLNWVVCGPSHNWDHWQLSLPSPREQNSHCCRSSLETAGLPFLGWLAGCAAAVPKSHKSPVKLILIANFCYIKILTLKLVPLCCSRFFPCTASPGKMFGLQVLSVYLKGSSLSQLWKKLLSDLLSHFAREKIPYYFPF